MANMEIEGEIKRGPGRPPLRREEGLRAEVRVSDSVHEAEEYARQLIESGADQGSETDEFYISPGIIPDGWSYQWKASHIAGKENGYHILSMTRSGWRPVPAERHPEMMPKGYSGPIEKKGLILMELPQIMVERANRRHFTESREVLINTERQLYDTPANTAPRDDPSVLARGLNKVGRSVVSGVPSAD